MAYGTALGATIAAARPVVTECAFRIPKTRTATYHTWTASVSMT